LNSSVDVGTGRKAAGQGVVPRISPGSFPGIAPADCAAGLPVTEVDGESWNAAEYRKIFVWKIRGGLVVSVVERHPETVSPLDPEPGLGGIFSLGLLSGKARHFLPNCSHS
jgi:hypothetical protein